MKAKLGSTHFQRPQAIAVLPECINRILHFPKALCLVLRDHDSSSHKQMLRFNCPVSSFFPPLLLCCFNSKADFSGKYVWFGPPIHVSLIDIHADGFHLEGWEDRQTLLTQKGTPPSSPLRRSGMYTVEFRLLSLEDVVEETGQGALHPRVKMGNGCMLLVWFQCLCRHSCLT